MKKVTMTILATAGAVLLTTGCSGTAAAPAQHEDGGYTLAVSAHQNPKQIRHAIDKAAEAKGWDVTTLNERTAVASKYVDGKSASVVIHYGNGTVRFEKNRATMSDSDFENEVEALQEAIEKALQTPSHH